jgi:hypothetical protein
MSMLTTIDRTEGRTVMSDAIPTPCPGCGLVVAPADGPTHAYIGGSPGCWATFNELMTAGAGVPGQLIGDTYAVQHPGLADRRAVQSVCVHLISLCAALERNWPADRAPHLFRQALEHPSWWRSFPNPVPPIGTITVADVLAEATIDDRRTQARLWAADLWNAYRPHHAVVRGWLATLIDGAGH